MGFLDDAMGSYKPPVAEDLEIALPPMRAQKKDGNNDAEQRELGQHGGGADGSPAATDAHSDVASGSAPEPVPQRDDPDDGEHTDSTEQEIAARAQAAATPPAEAPSETAEDVVDTEGASAPEDASEQAQEPVEVVPPANVKQLLAGIPGSEPRTFQKTGFSSGGAETLTVKRFPQVLLDRLRLSLAPAVGGEFAEALSAPALITAFLIAKTGVELDVDANTAVAVDVFRQVDPRLLAVENKIDDVMSDVATLADAMKRSLNRIAETGNIVDNMDFTLSYLVADRVVGLSTSDVDETNVDVTQKKVLVARERIRRSVKEQRTIEKNREGRRMT